ncbi:hypothetical protein [Thiomicrorhabdus sp.]|uniref:hypothetical protein n=1 Tax=Thiomicrorhabdus sp. TaxID=2039724 RepID=UPI0029C90021|nr:hypothetical protein [Thiomicrorhabdus sp.]
MLQHIRLDPDLCEDLRRDLNAGGWLITHQDVGQTELVGYGYVIRWEKNGRKVILNYADRQGAAEANLEISQEALAEIQALIARLPAE